MKRVLISAVAVAAAVCAVAVPTSQASSARAVTPPPAAAAHAVAVCPKPTPGHASCFAERLVHASATPDTPAGLTPTDLRAAYRLPAAAKAGHGTTVAIVDAFNDPFAESDLAVYRRTFNLAPCTTANGCFRKVNVHGQQSHYPPYNANWSSETALDLAMVGATCPGCHILLVEAASDSLDDLGAAVNEAVSLGAKYVSNSYGAPEDAQSAAVEERYFNHPRVAITVSTGDYNYYAGVQFPASSRYVTAVGGTSLTKDTSPRGWTETAWGGATQLNGTGSGCSAFIAKPAWQHDPGCPGRTLADVSAVADPYTGVAVYSGIDGGWIVSGGTSAASPIIASIYALAGDAATGDPSTGDATVPAARLYSHPADLNDVVSGDNGTCAPSYLCTSGPGYDGPTGLGTPDGLGAF